MNKKWTKFSPSLPGTYWYRCNKEVKFTTIHSDGFGGLCVCTGPYQWISLNDFIGDKIIEWCGPISKQIVLDKWG